MASMSPFASARSCTRPWWRDVFCPFAYSRGQPRVGGALRPAGRARRAPSLSLCGMGVAHRCPGRWELGGHVIEPKAVLATNDYHHLCSRALGGDVVTELPPFLAAAPIRERRLVPLLPQYPLPEWPINLLYPPHRHQSTIVRTYLDFWPELSPENRSGVRNLS